MMNFAELNRTQIKLFAIVGGLIVLVVVILLAFTNKPPGAPSADITLTVWGVNDTSSNLDPIFSDFAASYRKIYGRNIKINYQSWQPEDYEDTLVNKIAEGKGPDVAFVKNTWMLKHYPKFVPLPDNFGGSLPRGSAADIGFWTPASYADTFVKTASRDFVLQGKIYAVPLYVDSLGLYYNEDQYRQANVPDSRPGKTWDAMRDASKTLTIRAPGSSVIKRSGLAFGQVKNIRLHVQRADQPSPTTLNNGSDLISLLLLQEGGDYCDATCENVTFETQGLPTVREFLSWASPLSEAYSWSPTFTDVLNQQYVDDDVSAFLNGNVSTIVGYADLYKEISARTANTNLHLRAARIPQISASDGTVTRTTTLASYWGVAVTKNSQSRSSDSAANNAQYTAATELITYMGRVQPQMKHFTATLLPPAREDLLAPAIKAEPGLEPFISQAQYADSVTIYDEGALKTAITDAVNANAPDREDSINQISSAIGDAVRRMATNPGRTKPPPKPDLPTGVGK